MNRSACAVMVLLAAGARVHADPSSLDPAARETPFDRGHVSVTAGGGSQSAYGFRYFGVGVGAGYYVLDGLEVGLFALHEFGGGPSISEVSPSLRYVAQPLVGRWPLIPYAGVFYNHWFIGDTFSDLDKVGARGGFLLLSGRAIVGAGVAYEHTMSMCSQDCDSVYPDVTLGFSF